MVVTALMAAVSANAIVETSGGAATGGTFSPKDRRKSMGVGGGNAGDMGMRAGVIRSSKGRRWGSVMEMGKGRGNRYGNVPFTTTVAGHRESRTKRDFRTVRG